MTIEIVSLLKEKAITASDDAVTVNKTKAWTGARKTFKLSENPPVNIMVNGSPTINNFPISLLIQEFEKFEKNEDIEKMAVEFLDYIGKTVPKTNVKSFIKTKINEFSMLYGPIEKEEYEKFIELIKTIDIEIPKFIGNDFDPEFLNMIDPETPKKLSDEIKESIKKAFCQYLITESTGIVITGISNSHHFPTCISLNIILNNDGKIEIMNYNSKINYNRTEFEVFGQSSTVDSYLTGIDEELENEIYRLVEIIMTPTNNELKMLKTEIGKLKIHNKNRILRNIDTLSDNDLFEFMEILIKSTSLKTKLTSDIDSAGSEVHIEKITKERGIERKENVYKIIETKEKLR